MKTNEIMYDNCLMNGKSKMHNDGEPSDGLEIHHDLNHKKRSRDSLCIDFPEKRKLTIIHLDHFNHPCPQCDVVLRSSVELKKHIKALHSSSKFYCDVCRVNFELEEDMKKHLDGHIVANHSTALSKIKNRNTLSTKTYPCDHCDLVLNSVKEFNNHIVESHGESEYTCDICKKKFQSEVDLKFHDKTHFNLDHSLKAKCCKKCNKLYPDEKSLDYHYSIGLCRAAKKPHHINHKKFKCELCLLGFACESDYLKHKATHNGSEPKFAYLVSNEKSFCNICYKPFINIHRLKAHWMNHLYLDESGRFMKNEVNLWQCKGCDLRFQAGKELKEHIQLYHPGELEINRDITTYIDFKQNSVCEICNIEFDEAAHLEYHNKCVHWAKNLFYICEICDENCNSLIDLDEHSLKHWEGML